MFQATIILEDMIKTGYLRNEWCLDQSHNLEPSSILDPMPFLKGVMLHIILVSFFCPPKLMRLLKLQLDQNTIVVYHRVDNF
jgi:hypothetical protein